MSTPSARGPEPKQDRWALAYARVLGGQASPAQVSDPVWLEPPPGRFYADPFLVEHEGRVWVFFEDYDGATGRGHISASPLLEFAPRPALVRDWHLSYPYLVQEGDQLFCVPEQHERGNVTLYRCLDFPDRWLEEAVLLPDVPGVDPTLIQREDGYWMWLGRQDRRARDHTFLFYAPQLRGPWVEHRNSPAVTRADLARPAGRPWRSEGRWLRPAQDRRNTYGGAMVVYEVEPWTVEHYAEREVAHWQPHPRWPYPDGMHHLCHLGELMVWDAKRFVAKL